MSIATASAPLASKVKAENVAIVPPVEPVKQVETGKGSIQDVLNTLPKVEMVNPEPPADPGAFQAIVVKLGALISTQTSTMLAYYVERGKLVWEGIDVKLSRSTDKSTRAANRSSAVKALTMMAEMTVDTSCEPKPKVDVWLALAALDRAFKDVHKLPSVKVARELATTLTRVDPPASWDAPETYVLKDQYRADDVQALINRASLESMTVEQVSTEIERIGGRVMADPGAAEIVDATANADALAKRIMESIVAKDVNPFRFMETLQTHLISYGYALAPGHDDRGVSTYKLVKHGRTEAPEVEQPF